MKDSNKIRYLKWEVGKCFLKVREKEEGFLVYNKEGSSTKKEKLVDVIFSC